jgi:hypothetical protein
LDALLCRHLFLKNGGKNPTTRILCNAADAKTSLGLCLLVEPAAKLLHILTSFCRKSLALTAAAALRALIWGWLCTVFLRNLMIVSKIFQLGLFLTAVMLSGCTTDGPGEPSGAPPDDRPTARTASISLSAAEQARKAVAARLDIDPGEVEIVSSEAIDFADSSLGCPQPGMAYTQSITPGYQVLAKALEMQFDVRISGERALICERRARNQPDQRRT